MHTPSYGMLPCNSTRHFLLSLFSPQGTSHDFSRACGHGMRPVVSLLVVVSRACSTCPFYPSQYAQFPVPLSRVYWHITWGGGIMLQDRTDRRHAVTVAVSTGAMQCGCRSVTDCRHTVAVAVSSGAVLADCRSVSPDPCVPKTVCGVLYRPSTTRSSETVRQLGRHTQQQRPRLRGAATS